MKELRNVLTRFLFFFFFLIEVEHPMSLFFNTTLYLQTFERNFTTSIKTVEYTLGII